jgi:hypothetical protein
MIAQGKGPEATEFAGQIAAYVSENDIPVQVGMELAGQWGRIHWFTEPANAAQWEEINLRLLADEAYQKMLADAGDLFAAGMSKDTLVMLFPGS